MGRAAFTAIALPLKKLVICDEGCWIRHILAQHPIMAGHEAEAADAVRDPDVITLDTGSTRRRCFYKFNVGLIVHAPHVKVVVEFGRFRQRGYVVTAFCVNGVKSSEAITWQRTPSTNQNT